MGIDVYLYLGRSDRIEADFVAEVSGFLAWYRQALDEDPDFHDATLISTLTRFEAEGESAFVPSDREEADRIDALICLFLDDYCAYGPGQSLFEDAADYFRLHNLDGLEEWACRGGGAEIRKFWLWLLIGRPVGREEVAFASGYREGHVAHFSSSESQRLASVLEARLASPAEKLSERHREVAEWLAAASGRAATEGRCLVARVN